MGPDNHRADDDREREVGAAGETDELRRLRAADPAPADVVDEIATGARARALRAELTMQTENPTPHTPHTPHTDGPSPSPTWRRTALAGVALVALALGGVAVAVQLADDGAAPSDDVADPVTTPGTDPSAGEQPDVTPPGGGMAMCVAVYSPETLVDREVAFAGTITAMSGDDITFDVEEVFRGDIGDTATLGGAGFIGGINPDNPTPVAVGDRVLVAGDGGFAWGCGFTQPYDDEVAATWREAFTG